jgi:glycosyltransferase involved in cell wall biosynthesis
MPAQENTGLFRRNVAGLGGEMRPRIGIDAHMVGARETGNETYVLNLLQNLPQIDASNQFDYTAIALTPEQLMGQLRHRKNVDIVRIGPSTSFVRIPISMPLLAAREKLSLLHVTYVAPPVCPCPTIVSVHDIAYKLYPEYFPARVRLMLSLLVPLSMRRAAHVLTLSQSAKQDILAHYGIPESKVSVICGGVGSRFHVLTDRDHLNAVKAKYGIEGEFILAVGNLQPRKNIRRLIHAYSQLPVPVQSRYRLVIAGQALWKHSDIYRAAAECDVQHRITFTGYVSDQDLVPLYNAAALFVYPSLYEGFGLPILEAMACGTPVVTSCRSSLPEVAGEAALLVEPTNVEEIASAMERVLQDPALAQSLSEQGIRRARGFSWKRTAHQTLQVYEKVL